MTLLTGNLVYAAFRHDLSRNLDPQLHTHVVIANATQRPDGAWRAPHNVAIWRQASLIGAAYHAELRTELTGKHDQFEISGISRETVMEFSGRRADILAKAEALGLSSPQAMEAVALRTRTGKDAGDAAMARVLWAEKGQASGAEIHAVVGEAASRAARPRGAELAAAYSVAAGVRHLAEREASFGRTALVRAALGLVGSGTTARGVEAPRPRGHLVGPWRDRGARRRPPAIHRQRPWKRVNNGTQAQVNAWNSPVLLDKT